MTEKNPIEPLIDEISRFLQIFQDEKENPIQGEITADQAEMIIQLEMRVATARHAYERALQEEGMTPEQVREIMQKRSFMKPKDRDLLERLERMGKEARMIYFAVNHAVEKNRQLLARTGKRVKKKGEAGPRLGIGFRKGWKAL